MKSKWVSIILIIVILATLAACGGKSTDTESEDTTATTQPKATDSPSSPSASAKDTEEAHLVFFTWFGEAERDMGIALVDAFEEEHPNIKVDDNYIAYSDYHSKLNTLIAAGNTPDVFIINEYLANEWGEKGIVLNLKEIFAEHGRDVDKEYLPGAIYRTKPDNCWGLAWSQSATYLFYNKELFAEAGIEPPPLEGDPWTIDKLTEVAKQLTKDVNGKTPNDPDFDPNNVVVYGFLNMGAHHWAYLEGLLRTAGVRLTEDGRTWSFTSPKGIEAIQKLADLSLVHKCAPPLEIQRGTFNEPHVNLLNGQLAMLAHGSWGYQLFANEGFDVGVGKMPIFEKEITTASGAPFVIGADTKNIDAAFKFLTYTTSFENQVAAAEKKNMMMSMMPSNRAIFENQQILDRWYSLFDETLAKSALDILEKVEDPGLTSKVKGLAEAMDTKVYPPFDKVWLGELTAEELVRQLEPEIEGLLGGFWGDN
ncbi:MAG TPA: sugar ABC transporter substrate-binding protein [Clostridia bacterium]|nr:sugar ABC transporter substrate-binding protein [Clostridia bacterium]